MQSVICDFACPCVFLSRPTEGECRVLGDVQPWSHDRDQVADGVPLTWQVAAGRRLWLIDTATGDLRTCAVRQTSTVGVETIRCLSVSGGRFGWTFGPTVAP
jgi:hypothetical protein